MSKALIALCSSLVALLAAGMPHGVDARDRSDRETTAPYIDLTDDFTRFFDKTVGMDEATRVAQFHAQMDAPLPGFYAPRFGATPEQYSEIIARALKSFPELRARFELVQRDFPAAFNAGLQQFRQQFPGFRPNVPVYLLHSLGEMDGGTRELGGKSYLIFGADVIAQIHETHDLTPFLDHELFHVEHQKYFAGCAQMWCQLWAEGLATFAAQVMNPGADDRQLLLTIPAPIRAAVDAQWPAALCFTRARLLSEEAADVEALFVGGSAPKEFPQRFGYYVGLRVAEELGAQWKLRDMAQMPVEQVKPALSAGLDRMIAKAGGCKSVEISPPHG